MSGDTPGCCPAPLSQGLLLQQGFDYAKAYNYAKAYDYCLWTSSEVQLRQTRPVSSRNMRPGQALCTGAPTGLPIKANQTRRPRPAEVSKLQRNHQAGSWHPCPSTTCPRSAQGSGFWLPHPQSLSWSRPLRLLVLRTAPSSTKTRLETGINAPNADSRRKDFYEAKVDFDRLSHLHRDQVQRCLRLHLCLQKIHPYCSQGQFHLHLPLRLGQPILVRAKDNPGSISAFAKMTSIMIGLLVTKQGGLISEGEFSDLVRIDDNDHRRAPRLLNIPTSPTVPAPHGRPFVRATSPDGRPSTGRSVTTSI